jgi:hypothetical protein
MRTDNMHPRDAGFRDSPSSKEFSGANRGDIGAKKKGQRSCPLALRLFMARPERFELPTTKFVAWYSIQLSYGRFDRRLGGETCVAQSARSNEGRDYSVPGGFRQLPAPTIFPAGAFSPHPAPWRTGHSRLSLPVFGTMPPDSRAPQFFLRGRTYKTRLWSSIW